MSATWSGSAWSCTVRLVVTDDSRLTAATADLVALLDRVDRAASRFRTDSTLSRANANAGRPTPVPALLVDLVRAALDAAADTDGAVDPTVGLAMQRLGYDRDIAALDRMNFAPGGAATSRGSSEVAATPGAKLGPNGHGPWHAVRLNPAMGLLTVPRGCALDLGATAKAWTADLAARELAARYRTGVLVELGGDLAVAGERAGGWCVRVAEREGADGQVVDVTHGGITTSTTTVRTWTHDGRPAHHIVDPATGEPTDGPWRTATVWAPSAFAANVASTASIVKGDDALQWLTSRGTAARLVHRTGAVVTTPAWPSVTPVDHVFLPESRSTTSPTTPTEENLITTGAAR